MIDADAHLVEYTPGILDTAAEIGGAAVRRRIEEAFASTEPGGAAIKSPLELAVARRTARGANAPQPGGHLRRGHGDVPRVALRAAP